MTIITVDIVFRVYLCFLFLSFVRKFYVHETKKKMSFLFLGSVMIGLYSHMKCNMCNFFVFSYHFNDIGNVVLHMMSASLFFPPPSLSLCI